MLLGDVEGWLLGLPDGLVLLGMKAPWIKKWTRCRRFRRKDARVTEGMLLGSLLGDVRAGC